MSELFVSCPPHLDALLLREMESMGIKKARKGHLGVFAPKTIENVYKINYCSRIATRVLWPLSQFPCKDREELYRQAKKIPWSDYLKLDQTFAIDANVTHPNLRNSLFAAFVVKDAICDQLRDKLGSRPSVDVAKPDVQINLFIEKGYASISLDTSNLPLYKRGWREESVFAPIQESLAAAILYFAKYSPEKILCDPFCGSGTFLIEAAMMATNTPAGFFRNFWGFFHMPEFTSSEWDKIKKEADSKKTPLPKDIIFGADKDPKAVDLCKAHLLKTGFHEAISLRVQDVRSLACPVKPSLIVCNPPYGKRLSTSSDIFKHIGEFIKRRCSPSAESYVLAPDYSFIKEMGMQVKRKLPLISGGFDVTLFELSLENLQ